MTSSLTATAMLAVGGVEAIVGAIFVFAPGLALQLVLGRTLTVGASKAPGVAPLISQTGALRLALSVFLVAIGLCGASESMEPDATRMLAAVAVASRGLLQPYMLLFRSHIECRWAGKCACALEVRCSCSRSPPTASMRPSWPDLVHLRRRRDAVLAAAQHRGASRCAALAGDAELARRPRKSLSTGLLFDEARRAFAASGGCCIERPRCRTSPAPSPPPPPHPRSRVAARTPPPRHAQRGSRVGVPTAFYSAVAASPLYG